MARILGLSAFFHDSAAALVIDGVIVAAAQEERFSRIKHDPNLPLKAVEYCLREGGLRVEDIDHIVFYEQPRHKFNRLLQTYLSLAPAGWETFAKAIPSWLRTKLRLAKVIREALGITVRVEFIQHHESHAASAFFPSPAAESAVLTVDGVGEWATATICHGSGNQLQLLAQLDFPHSPGLLYSTFTAFCGFRVNSGEYKLMGLAPYGQPRYADVIRRELVDLRPDGSLRLNLRYFNFPCGQSMASPQFDALFSGPARSPESPITARELDLAASVQQIIEEIVLNMARHARRLTGARHLCMAGGVALNCVANGALQRAGIFDDVWVQPAAGDAGGALGAALFWHHVMLNQPRTPQPSDAMRGACLGPKFSNDEVLDELRGSELLFHHLPQEQELLIRTAQSLAAGEVVGWFHGRMEFGPRSLGARSILGDARNPAMQSQMNLRIKFRESFRPFAPAVLEEDCAKWFEFAGSSPYMLSVARVRPDQCLPLTPEHEAAMRDPNLCRRLDVPRSKVPAITHVDRSARLQTVDEGRHGRFARLLREFRRQTGVAILINTSFNVRGEPIVCTPADAIRCFLMTDMDMLVLEDCVLYKDEQSARSIEERSLYLANFALD
jgi:carbamoyltransferase